MTSALQTDSKEPAGAPLIAGGSAAVHKGQAALSRAEHDAAAGHLWLSWTDKWERSDRHTLPNPAAISPVLFPIEAQPGEGILGLLARTAAENKHATTRWILDYAGFQGARGFSVTRASEAACHNLALALGQPSELIRSSRWSRFIPENKAQPILADFHGAVIVENELRPQFRRVAPLSLRDAAHHRDIWLHGLLPYCPETGGLLIDRCPNEHCRQRLGWHHCPGIHRCEHCRVDLRNFDVGTIDEEIRAAARPLVDLIDPSLPPAERTNQLPDELMGLDPGALFQLGCKLGQVAEAVGDQQTDHSQSSVNARILAAGGAMLSGYPDSLARHAREVDEALGHDAAYRHFRALRKAFRVRGPHQSTMQKLRRNSPEVFGKRAQKGANRLLNIGLNSGDAAKTIGISDAKLVLLRRNQLVLPIFTQGGETNAHSSFDRQTIESIRADVAMRGSRSSIASRFGLSRHGVEQLVSMGHLVPLASEVMEALYEEPQCEWTSVDRLLNKLVEQSSCVDPVHGIRLSRALKIIGGRHKPWGPIIEAMLAGVIRYQLLQVECGRFLENTIIHLEDLPRLLECRFVETGGVEHSTSMTRQDATSLLNVGPTVFQQILADELKDAVLTTENELAVPTVLALAQNRISAGEIAIRWMGGTRTLPECLKADGTIPRLGPAGWSRRAVEEAMTLKTMDRVSDAAAKPSASLRDHGRTIAAYRTAPAGAQF